MDQEVEIINTNTRNEKIKNFFVKFKKLIILIFIIIILSLFSVFYYQEHKENKKINLADKYNLLVEKFDTENNNNNIVDEFKNIIKIKDKTYSPLAFYFLLDNDLIKKNDEINKFFDKIRKENTLTESTIYKLFSDPDFQYSDKLKLNLIDLENSSINKFFDILIYEINLDEEIKNLTIYKKALFNSDFSDENVLLEILSPVIKSESIWRPHALYLMAEYYFAKNQINKSKDFFEQIITIENVNPRIKLESQKRLRADFSE